MGEDWWIIKLGEDKTFVHWDGGWTVTELQKNFEWASKKFFFLTGVGHYKVLIYKLNIKIILHNFFVVIFSNS
jgi:hypothetical protein